MTLGMVMIYYPPPCLRHSVRSMSHPMYWFHCTGFIILILSFVPEVLFLGGGHLRLELLAHPLKLFFAPKIKTLFWYSFLGATIAHMVKQCSKKRSQSYPKYNFLPTWGTSFRYGIYQSGATLAHPGEVPKAIKKTSPQKTQNWWNISHVSKSVSFWERVFVRICCKMAPDPQ